jgi:hypothetical protein
MPSVSRRPPGRTFSASTTSASTAIQATLIIPTANSTTMSAQQQPAHHSPCSPPISSAPLVPGRQQPVDGVGAEPIGRPHEQVADREGQRGRTAARVNTTIAGSADGSIIAAIMVVQTPRNQPSAPRSVPGPASIPRCVGA